MRELESVVAVYTYKSFTEASYQTSFSLSVISKHIKKVEQELGVVLFNRRAYDESQLLTEDGKRIMPSIIKAVDNIQFIRKQIYLAKNEPMSVVIGGMSMMYTGVFDEILSDFCLKYPQINLESLFMNTETLIRGINSGELDGGFVLYIGSEKDIAVQNTEIVKSADLSRISIYRTGELYVGLSENHKLADRKSVDLRDLSDETFLFNMLQVNNTKATERVTRLAGREDHEVKKVFMDFKHYSSVMNIIASGHAVLPKVMKNEIIYPGVRFIRVENWEYVSEYIMLYNKNNYGKAFLKFKDHVEEHCDGRLMYSVE